MKVTPNPDRLTRNEAYMQMAEVWAKRSKSNRMQVGALIVNERGIISDGYNGMPASTPIEDDVCETVIDPTKPIEPNNLITRPEVLHAEVNAISKLKNSNENANGAEMFVTMAPCKACATHILNAGIKKVYYRRIYRDSAGIEELIKNNVEVELI